MKLKERYKHVINYFETVRPLAETELIYRTPFELIVAVILSAQCTDKRVNTITPSLFSKYPDPIKMSEARPEDIFNIIKSCSYPNSKARYLSGMSRLLVNDFEGNVPSERSNLEKLPGVGRKTANVVSSIIYNKPYMAVDTHVFRVSARIGLTKNAKTPLDAERQLTENLPDEIITKAHHWLLLHGRYVCKAKNPLCGECGIKLHCMFFNNNAV